MLRIKLTYLDILNPSNPLIGQYYFSSESLDYNNIFWEPRITDSFEIERFFDVQLDTSNRIRTLQVTLDNSDRFFNQFMTKTTTLLNNLMSFYYDNGNGLTKSFTGKIQSVDKMGSTVQITVREIGYEYLENTFPDAQIAYDYYSDSGINESWNCIPIHFGTVNRIPLSWVNSFYSEYMIGSGPILRVNKIYIDDAVIYDKDDNTIEYRPTKDSFVIKARIFRGTGYDADGKRETIVDTVRPQTLDPTRETASGSNITHISQWGGFAYIQLYSIDKDGYEIPAYPYNTDGAIGQVYVDIEGIVSVTKSGNTYTYGNTAIRNPAQIIKLMFCQPELVSEGPCAIGWGYKESDVDFAQAITDCNTLGFRVDGSFDSSGQFVEALKQILYVCRGYIVEENEKITLHIDKKKTNLTPVVEFDEEGIYGSDCNLEEWNEPDLDSQINRVKLTYDWSQEYNRYNKKPDANHESPDYTTNSDYDSWLVDTQHNLKVQKWNTEEIELKLVTDTTTAHRLAVYYLRKKTLQHVSGSLQCANSTAMNLDAGDLISIRSVQFDWYGETNNATDTSKGKLFQVTSIKKGSELTNIDFIEYDNAIFDADTVSFTLKQTPEKVADKIQPRTPTNVTLRVSSTIIDDGTTMTSITGKIAYADNSNHLFANIQYCDCGTVMPIPSGFEFHWIDYGNIYDDSFTINGLTPGHYYQIKVSTANVNGYSEPYTTDYLQLAGDTEAPGVPSFTLSSYLKTVTATINLYTVPNDISGFELWRSTNAQASNYGILVGSCAVSYDGNGSIADVVPDYEVTYHYSVRAFDTWGNYSPYSSKMSITCQKASEDDIDEDVIGGGSVPYALITSDEIHALFETQ